MEKSRNGRHFLAMGLALIMFFTVMHGTVHASKTLKIGVIAALTGPAAPWGLGVLHGVEMAVEDAGPEVTVGGEKYKIEVIPYDDKHSGTEAVAVLNRFVARDKGKFVIGPVSTPSALAMKEIIVRQNVLQLANTFTDKLLDPTTKSIFRVLATPVEYTPYFAKWVRGWFDKNVPGRERTYAFLAPNDELGLMATKYESGALEAQGFKIITKEFYERGTKDFAPILTKIMALNPSMFDFDSSPPGDAGLIVKQIRQLGFKGQITYSGGPAFDDIVRIAGEYGEGLIGWSPQNTDDPKIKDLAERHQKKYGQPMNLLMPNFYVATQLLLVTLQQAGTVEDVDKIINILENIKYTGIFGTIRWVGKETYGINRQVLHDMYVGKIVGGKCQIIDVLKVH